MVQSLPYKIRSQTNRSLFFISQKKKIKKKTITISLKKFTLKKLTISNFTGRRILLSRIIVTLTILKLNGQLFKSRILYLHL